MMTTMMIMMVMMMIMTMNVIWLSHVHDKVIKTTKRQTDTIA